MLKNRLFLKTFSKNLKVLSISLAVLLVLIGLAIYDHGILNSRKNNINPPIRNIVHNKNLGQIIEFNLMIDKLGLNAPTIPNVDGKDKKIYNEALNDGVAHYKNTALPGSGSNIVIFGHSSTVLGIGKYANVFASLNTLNINDEVKINYNQKEYKYFVSEKKIILADDFSVIMPTEREMLTLLTCWPVGTADKRLVIIAKPSR